jgi:hypothetical protein
MSEINEAQGRRSVRQAARRAALDAQATLRSERQERDKRLAAITVEVLVALGERDAAVAKFEHRAGAGLRRLIDDERLTVAEAARWFGPGLTRQEIARLRRLAGDREQRADASSRDVGRKPVGGSAEGTSRSECPEGVTRRAMPPQPRAT